MKRSLQITNELNDIITQLIQTFVILSIDEVDGVSTINPDPVTIFDNLSKVMVLQEGMIITINNINYPVANVVNLPGGRSFDITTTGLVATEWNVAANFKPATRREINQILQQTSIHYVG